MKITILNTAENHPINPWLNQWIKRYQCEHKITLIRSKSELQDGDVLFLISCSEVINASDRNKFQKTLVIHASDLPKGRGWSPHVWGIINGADDIVVSLLEANDKVDTGRIWAKLRVNIPKTALYREINNLLFNAELQLMDFALANFVSIVPAKQNSNITPSYWPKRTPADSEIDINKSIDEQFDLIRVCDPHRSPAFFYIDGKKIILKVESTDD